MYFNKTISTSLWPLCFWLVYFQFSIIYAKELKQDRKHLWQDIASSEEQRDFSQFRLPTDLKPLAQTNRIRPFLHGNSTYDGLTNITFEVVNPTNNITMHQFNLRPIYETIEVYEETDPLGPLLPIINIEYQLDKHFWVGTMAQDLEVGKIYTIIIDYEADLKDAYYGFFRDSYTSSNGEETFYAATYFLTINAREAFPCFDEPAYKIPYNMQIIREENTTAVFNTHLESSEPLSGEPGWIVDTFLTTENMSAYLNAFFVSDFVFTESVVGNVTYRVFSQPELLTYTSYSLSKTPEATDFFTNYFNIPYAMDKMDSVAFTNFDTPGVSENWGLLFYEKDYLLFDETLNSASEKQIICEYISRNVAHQWLGNLVTAEWWDYFWIQEGFAEYFAFLACDALEPEMKITEQFVGKIMHQAFDDDDSEGGKPLIYTYSRPIEVRRIFRDDLILTKGGAVVRMMEYFLSETTLKAGLSTYLDQYKFSSATADDMFEILTGQALQDQTLDDTLTVKMVMDTWTLQNGYPVITVNRTSDGNALITQERFLMRDENTTDTNDYKWYIPITYATQTSPDFFTFNVTWMLPIEEQKWISGLPSLDQWVIFNVRQGAFFRVNYDDNGWTKIINQLKIDPSVIHVLNRVQLINDAHSLAMAGLVPYSLALSLNEYLVLESEFAPYYTALRSLAYIETMMKRQANYPDFRNYLLSIVIPLYDSVGFLDSVSDTFMNQKKREIAVKWACYLEHEPCIENAVNVFSNWMLVPDDYFHVTPNIRESVWCSGVRNGSIAEWDFAYDRYLNAAFSTHQTDLAYAMACTQDSSLINLLLNYTFTSSSGISKLHSTVIMESLANYPVGQDIAWSFLQANDDIIDQYMKTYSAVTDYVYIISRDFNTNAQLQELEQFKLDNADQVGLQTGSIDAAIERTKINIEWMETYYNDIIVPPFQMSLKSILI